MVNPCRGQSEPVAESYGKVSLAEFNSALQQCSEAMSRMEVDGSRAQLRAKLQAAGVSSKESVARNFTEACDPGKDHLKYGDFVKVLRKLVPDIDMSMLRQILAGINAVDANADGKITAAECAAYLGY